MGKKLRALLALLFFSSFLSQAPGAISAAAATSAALTIPAPLAEQGSGQGHRKFVIYYGWYPAGDGSVGPDLARIIQSQPDYVISPYLTSTGQVNLLPEVVQSLHENGIKVLVYVATGNGQRALEGVFGEMKAGFDAGADGVMLDEVSTLQTEDQVDHYRQIYDYAKEAGDKLVIANPGTILVSEKVMEVSDIVSFEHQWRLAPRIDWFSKYPPERYMGISSNDIAGVMGYAVDGKVAARDTVEAWQSGIGYHYSTDSYITLPLWFEGYQQALADYGASGAASRKLHELKVRTISEADGREVAGLWVEVKKGDSVVMTGFSPARFMLPAGSYSVGASSYQSFVFSHWQQAGPGAGTSPPPPPAAEHRHHHYYNISLEGDGGSGEELVAVYKNELALLKVDSFDVRGNSIRGMYVTVSRASDGQPAVQGFTPLRASLPPGSYSMSASSYAHYQFVKWEDDGSTEAARKVELASDTSVAAYYNNTLADRIGSKVFDNNGNSGCYDPVQHRQKAADSALRGGDIAGMLELYRSRSIVLAGCNDSGGDGNDSGNLNTTT